MSTIVEIAAAILVSLGGAGAIILGLSGYLGKLWAQRLMEQERASYQARLKALEADLHRESERLGHTYKEKLALYKEVSLPIVELLVEAMSKRKLNAEEMKLFEKKRLATTALLGMFAPSDVFASYNDLIDFLYDSLEGKSQFTFPEFRNRALLFLTQIRRDIGVFKDELTYNGTR